MSQYHKHCGTSFTPTKKPSRNKKPKATKNIPDVIEIEPESKPTNVSALLTTKAFCDCSHCACRDCPDILKLLSITVSDTTCRFGSKVSDQAEIPKASKPATSTLLDIINPERDCSCGIVARGIRDHIHMNIGMTGRRDKITQQIDLFNKNPKRTKRTAPGNSKSLVTKDNTTAEDTTPVEKCPMCGSRSAMSNTT